MVHDIPGDSASISTYECLRCGEILTGESHPGECPVCGGMVQNRSMSLE